MASLSFKTNKGSISDDNYYTPKSAWQEIEAFLPNDKLVWEAFYGDGTSANYLREIGCNVVSKDVDFFDNKIEFDCIVTNPPYSFKKKVFERLRELDKSFILLLPVSTITKAFYQDYFAQHCGVIVPKKRIHFIKGKDQTTRCWFDTLFICYKIEGVGEKQIIYL